MNEFMNSSNRPRVFISYGHEDADLVVELSRQLTAYGADVWLDRESLLPGSDWKREIRRAIRSCRYFVAILSTSSVNRRGFVNVEISSALEILNEFPKGEIFVIPVRLNECKPSHDELSDLNWLDLFPDWNKGFYKLLQALGIAEIKSKFSIFDVKICGRCGSADIEAVERRFLPHKAFCIVCHDCGWSWIGPEDLSDKEYESLRMLYGDIRVERRIGI